LSAQRYLRTIFVLGVSTGMRLGEIRNLRKRNVALARSRIILAATKKGERHRPETRRNRAHFAARTRRNFLFFDGPSMRPEYDFSKGVRGNTFRGCAGATTTRTRALDKRGRSLSGQERSFA
jgi:integrase